MKAIWQEITKPRKIAIAVIAAIWVVLAVLFFLTTDHAFFAVIKCAFAAIAAAPFCYVLVMGKERVREIFGAHKKALLVILLVELVLFLFMFFYFYLIVGVADFYRIVQLSVALVMALLLFFVFVGLCVRKKEPWRVYWKTAIVLGLLFVLLQPVGAVPDEERHWAWTYHESDKMMGVPLGENGNIVMRKEDTQIPLAPLSNAPDDYITYWFSIAEDTDQDQLVQTGSQPHPYLKETYQYWPQALGITLGRLLGMGGTLTFLLGRLFNLALFILLLTLAIKWIPFGKTLLFLIATLPMTLQEASSYSPDVMIIGFSALIVALTLKLAYGGEEECAVPAQADVPEAEVLPARKRPGITGTFLQYVLLLASCFLLLPLKGYAYAPLCFLPLLIVIRKWKQSRKEAVVALAVLLGVVAIFAAQRILPMFLQTGVFDSTAQTSYTGDEKYTLSVFLQDPKEIVHVILNTYVGYGAFYLESMIGTPLQWLNVHVNGLYIYFYVVLLTLASLRRKQEEVCLGVKAKLYIQFLAWFSVAAVLLGMLLAYSPASVHRIEGVQGRYFIPCLLPMLLSLRAKGISIRKSYDTGIVLASLVALFGVVQWIMMTRGM